MILRRYDFYGFNVHEKKNSIGLSFDDFIEYIFSPRIAADYHGKNNSIAKFFRSALCR
jgi:hypothetical protein